MAEIQPRDPTAGVGEVPLIQVALELVRRRRLIVAMAFAGVVLGSATAFVLPRRYVSQVVFIPQTQEGVASGLALAASQFGIRVPSTGDGWGPGVYVELLKSRTILEPLAAESLAVPELDGRRVSVVELLEVTAGDEARLRAKSLRALRSVLSVAEDEEIGAVRLSVNTRWASVSQQIASRLVESVDRFNVQMRRSQASQEREFVEQQVAAAQQQLRQSEDRLELFLRRNRSVDGAAELVFERDRITREVQLKQQILTTLAQSLEEARIREVRDTPVITQIESSQLALQPQPRGTIVKAFLGAVIGLVFAIGIVIVRQRLMDLRAAESREVEELLAHLPFLRRLLAAP